MEYYVERCVRSVISQTYQNIEIIIIDDGSTDSTFSICAELGCKDYRIRIFQQSNCGASMARNKGLDTAKGKYIMFVDSDDWIEPNMLDRLYEDLVCTDAALVISQVPFDKMAQIGNNTLSKEQGLKKILQGFWWGPVGKLFKREAIGSIRFPKATISEDYVFMAKVVSQCEKTYYNPHCFYHREVREGSLSRLQLSERKFDEFHNMIHVCDYIQEKYPHYLHLAKWHLAETSIKLLFCIYDNHAEKLYEKQKRMILSSISNNYWDYLLNHNIKLKTRLLLACCFSYYSSKFAANIYSKLP